MRHISLSWTSFRAALFPSFPGGRAGVALLLLRLFVGTAFLFHGKSNLDATTQANPGPKDCASFLPRRHGGHGGFTEETRDPREPPCPPVSPW